MDGAVTRGQDVRTRLRLPGGTLDLLVEQVCGWRVVSRPDHYLLLLRKIAGEILHAFREHPDSPLSHFDVLEAFRGGELAQLAVHRRAGVRGDCGDVDQPGDAVIRSRGGDDGSAVRMANEDRGAAHAPQGAFYCGDVRRLRVEAVLRGHHLVTFRLERGDHLVEARPVGPDPVTEHDARFALQSTLHIETLLRNTYLEW